MASQKSSAKSEMQHGYSCLPAKAYGFASLQNRTLKAAGQKQGPDFSTRACIRRSLFGDLPSDPHDRTGMPCTKSSLRWHGDIVRPKLNQPTFYLGLFGSVRF
jgi:hypothetical protein